MIGSIAGDVIGSVFEHRPHKSLEFPLFSQHSTFTDDTVLSLAIAFAILEDMDYGRALKLFARRYPHAGYGGAFRAWAISDSDEPYGSWGNGSAMRVSPVGFAFDTLDDVLAEAARSAMVTHDHPEGIKGAQATALAVFLSRSGESKEAIREDLVSRFSYNLDRHLSDIRPSYTFDVSCQGSVPESIIAFLESENYEDAVRKAISLGGDSDTMACIAGAVAHAYYREVPAHIESTVRQLLPADLLEVLDRFTDKFIT